jgi:hypothetical protein
MGVTSRLLPQLETIARENGFSGFAATTMEENEAMLHVFKKHYPHAETTRTKAGELRIVMDFDKK